MTDAELEMIRENNETRKANGKTPATYRSPAKEIDALLDYVDFLRRLVRDQQEESSNYQRGRADERAELDGQRYVVTTPEPASRQMWEAIQDHIRRWHAGEFQTLVLEPGTAVQAMTVGGELVDVGRVRMTVGTLEVDLNELGFGRVRLDGREIPVRRLEVLCEAGVAPRVRLDVLTTQGNP